MALEITLVDQPDKTEFGPPEAQRAYKITDGTAKHTVRISRDKDSYYRYNVENLVAGKWHRLLTGETVGREIPFDAAVARAAAVLL